MFKLITLRGVAFVATAALLVSGCSRGHYANQTNSGEEQLRSVRTYAATDHSRFSETGLSKEQTNLLQQRELHFAFDSFRVSELDKSVVMAHAKYLLEHPNINLRLEGYTDERGSSEYNVALGERRAQAVQQVFLAAGIPADRISLVSFGEEKPADPHHNEAAWQKNRRAMIIYG